MVFSVGCFYSRMENLNLAPSFAPMNKNKLLSDINLLAVSTGLIYLWFGGLKFFSNLSPAEELATNTIDVITFGLLSPNVSIYLLAIWEVLVGVFLIFRLFPKQTAILGLVHIVCTFLPILFFYELCFAQPPLGFSLLGQYIFKNVLIFAAFVVIYRQAVQKKA